MFRHKHRDSDKYPICAHFYELNIKNKNPSGFTLTFYTSFIEILRQQKTFS